MWRDRPLQAGDLADGPFPIYVRANVRRRLTARRTAAESVQFLERLMRDHILPLVMELRLKLRYHLALQQYDQMQTTDGGLSSPIAPEIARSGVG
jgi:hypothetical protein